MLRSNSPTLVAQNVTALTPEALCGFGFTPANTVLAYDLERVLTPYKGTSLFSNVVSTLEAQNEAGYEKAAISNSSATRLFTDYYKMLIDYCPPSNMFVPYVTSKNGQRRWYNSKPFPQMTLAVAALTGKNVLAIGDQWFKDSLQAPLANMVLAARGLNATLHGAEDNGDRVTVYSVLLNPQGTEDHPGVQNFQRPYIDRPALALMGLGSQEQFPEKLTLASEFRRQRALGAVAI